MSNSVGPPIPPVPPKIPPKLPDRINSPTNADRQMLLKQIRTHDGTLKQISVPVVRQHHRQESLNTEEFQLPVPPVPPAQIVPANDEFESQTRPSAVSIAFQEAQPNLPLPPAPPSNNSHPHKQPPPIAPKPVASYSPPVPSRPSIPPANQSPNASPPAAYKPLDLTSPTGTPSALAIQNHFAQNNNQQSTTPKAQRPINTIKQETPMQHLMKVKAAAAVNESKTDDELIASLSSMSACQAAVAFAESELQYIEGLRIIIEMYMERIKNYATLGRPLLAESEYAQLFLNIPNIYDFNFQLYNNLDDMLSQSPEVLLNNLGKVLLRVIPFFKLYTQYVQEHRNAAKFFVSKCASSSDFAFFIKLEEMTTKTHLSPLLHSPIKRLATYLIYLGVVYEKLDKQSSPALELEKAILAIQSVTDNIATFLKTQAAQRSVSMIQQNVFGGSIDIILPHRFSVKYGKVKTLTENMFGKGFSWSTNHFLALFNDMVLIGKPKSSISGGVKYILQLTGMDIEDMAQQRVATEMLQINLVSAFRIKTRSHKPIIFGCSSPAEKDIWIEKLRDAVTQFEGRIGKSMGTEAQLACLSAEDFEKVIRKNKLPQKTWDIAAENAKKHYEQASAAAACLTVTEPSAPVASTANYSAPLPTPVIASPPQLTSPGKAPPIPARRAVPAVPIAPVMSSAPIISPDNHVPTAPSLDPVVNPSAPIPPPLSTNTPPVPPVVTSRSSPPPTPSNNTDIGRNDLLASIRSAGLQSLKKISVNSPPLITSPHHTKSAPSDLGLALKSSLDRYRAAVADDDEDDTIEDNEEDWD